MVTRPVKRSVPMPLWLIIVTRQTCWRDSVSIFSTRQRFLQYRNCWALHVRWRKLVVHTHWHRCCTRQAPCSTAHHSQRLFARLMPKSRPVPSHYMIGCLYPHTPKQRCRVCAALRPLSSVVCVG